MVGFADVALQPAEAVGEDAVLHALAGGGSGGEVAVQLGDVGRVDGVVFGDVALDLDEGVAHVDVNAAAVLVGGMLFQGDFRRPGDADGEDKVADADGDFVFHPAGVVGLQQSVQTRVCVGGGWAVGGHSAIASCC